MCIPAGVMAGLAVASGGAQMIAQRQQYKQQKAMTAQAAALQQQQTAKQVTGEKIRFAQERETAARQSIMQDLEQAKRAATEVTAIGESNTTSIAALDDQYAEYGFLRKARAAQRKRDELGYGMALEEIRFGGQMEQARIARSRPTRPSLGLGLLSTALNAATTYKTFSE